MRTGVAFSTIIEEVKLEAGETTSPAQATTRDPRIKQIINREYRWIAQKWRWPLRHDEVEVSLVADTQTYTFPATLDPANIDEVWTEVGTTWQRVPHGVGRLERSLYSDTETSWPPHRFEFQPDTGTGTITFEVWPIPSQAGTVRISGQLVITDLVNDSDKCLLDADVLVLRSASQLLAVKNRADAAYKANQAEQRAETILRNQGPGIGPEIHHGRRPRMLEPWIDYIPPGYDD